MLVSKDHGFGPGREPGVTGIRSAASTELGGGGGPEGYGGVDAGGVVLEGAGVGHGWKIKGTERQTDRGTKGAAGPTEAGATRRDGAISARPCR